MKFLCITLMLWIVSGSALAADKSEIAAVEKNVTMLTQAMIDADAKALNALTSKNLSYGHSSGTIENKTQFIDKIVSGQSDFVSIELLKQTVQVNGTTALVRHDLDAKTNDKGKPGTVYLGVLLVWEKVGSDWQLLARQAFRYPK